MLIQPPIEPDAGIDLSNFCAETEIEKVDGISAKGFQILVRLYIPPKKIGSIYIPDSSHDDFQYSACTGLVVQRGKASYGKRFDHVEEDKVWCNVGEWILFPRHEGIQIKIDGLPYQFLNDSSVLAVVDNPERIKR